MRYLKLTDSQRKVKRERAAIAHEVCELQRQNPTMCGYEALRIVQSRFRSQKAGKPRQSSKGEKTGKQKRQYCPSCRKTFAVCNFKGLVCVWCDKDGYGGVV